MLRHPSTTFRIAALSLALSLAATTAAAQDDDRERARTEFQRGVDAYGSGDFATALEAFQEAYRLAPHPMVRVNIANAYERLSRPLEALVHFERFLAEAPSASPQQRREVESAIRRLRQQVGAIEVHVVPDGALVIIDDAEQRRAPIAEPVRVVAGEHTVDVQLEGFRTEHRSVTVVGGQVARLDVRLSRAEVVAAVEPPPAVEPVPVVVAPEPEPIVPVEPEPPPPAQDGGFRITAGAWIAGSITLAAGIGAAITGGLALAADADFDRNVEIYEDPLQPEEVREQARLDGLSAADTANTLAMVSDALLITTIVGAGATTFFLIAGQEGGMLDEETDPGAPVVAVVPWITPERGGVSVAGAF